MAYSYQNFSTIADAPSNYYWTVATREEIGRGGSSPEDGYVFITAPSKRVNWKHEVYYDIRVWKLVNGVPQQLSDEVVEVLVPQSYRTQVAENLSIGTIVARTDTPEAQLFGDKNLFYVGFTAKVPNYTFTPRFLIQLKPNTAENSSAAPLEVLPASSILGVPKTINFSEGEVDPQIPQNILNDAAYNSLQGLITRNNCVKPNTWVALIVQEQSGQRYIYIKNYKLDGTFISQELIGKDTLSGGTGPDKIDHYELGRRRVIALKANECFGDDTPATPDTGITLPPDPDKVRYNPPNHFVTRSVSHGERTKDAIFTKINDVQTALDNRNRRLGKIYQSVDGAAALNKPQKGEVKLWGFRFTYNPQTMSYNTSTNTSIDWMLNSKDPANLLGGNTTVSLQLYLNRIADMTELRSAKGGDFSRSYPRALRKEEIDGLLYRGTEYDLEFLYRVLNGDPGKTSLLEYNGKTADFGYITGTPCWFHLHNNLKYYGSMASLSVNHVMFTQDMVPMLSTVDISFIRYPSLELSPEEVRRAYEEQASRAGSTGEEAKAGK